MLSSEAGLAGSGRACEEEDRSLLLLLQFHDRKVLDDPFLDFFKAVVVAFEYHTGLFDIDALLLFRYPREIEQEIEVISYHRTFMVVGATSLEFFHLDQCLFADIVRHL